MVPLAAPSMPRLFFVGLAILAAARSVPATPAEPAEQGALTVANVLTLVRAEVSEGLVEALVGERGFVGPIGVDEVLELKEAGATDEFLHFLLEALPDTEVTVVERDGVVIVTGRGSVDDSVAAPAPEPPAAPPAVVVQVAGPAQAEAAPETAPPGEVSGWNANPYPAGAVVGNTGTALFLPARFGEPASSFGRTVVSLTGVSPWCGTTPCCAVAPPAHPVTVPADASGRYGSVTIRTSRGPLRLPN